MRIVNLVWNTMSQPNKVSKNKNKMFNLNLTPPNFGKLVVVACGKGDPCHHVQDTTVRESGQENAEKTSVLPREPSSGSLAPSPIKTSGGTEAGSTASHGVKETDRDRSAAHRRREGSATHPIGRGGGQSSAETRHERKRGNRPPDQSLAGFGDPTRCPGEALLWQS